MEFAIRAAKRYALPMTSPRFAHVNSSKSAVSRIVPKTNPSPKSPKYPLTTVDILAEYVFVDDPFSIPSSSTLTKGPVFPRAAAAISPSPVSTVSLKTLRRQSGTGSLNRKWFSICDMKEPIPKAPHVAIDARLRTIMGMMDRKTKQEDGEVVDQVQEVSSSTSTPLAQAPCIKEPALLASGHQSESESDEEFVQLSSLSGTIRQSEEPATEEQLPPTDSASPAESLCFAAIHTTLFDVIHLPDAVDVPVHHTSVSSFSQYEEGDMSLVPIDIVAEDDGASMESPSTLQILLEPSAEAEEVAVGSDGLVCDGSAISIGEEAAETTQENLLTYEQTGEEWNWESEWLVLGHISPAVFKEEPELESPSTLQILLELPVDAEDAIVGLICGGHTGDAADDAVREPSVKLVMNEDKWETEWLVLCEIDSTVFEDEPIFILAFPETLEMLASYSFATMSAQPSVLSFNLHSAQSETQPSSITTDGNNTPAASSCVVHPSPSIITEPLRSLASAPELGPFRRFIRQVSTSRCVSETVKSAQIPKVETAEWETKEAELLKHIENLQNKASTSPPSVPKQCTTCSEACAKCNAPIAFSGPPPPPPPPPGPPPPVTIPPVDKNGRRLDMMATKTTDTLKAVEKDETDVAPPNNIAAAIKARMAASSDGRMGLKPLKVNKDDPVSAVVTDIAGEIKARFKRSAGTGLRVISPPREENTNADDPACLAEFKTFWSKGGKEHLRPTETVVKDASYKGREVPSGSTSTDDSQSDAGQHGDHDMEERDSLSRNESPSSEFAVSIAPECEVERADDSDEDDYISRRMVKLRPARPAADVKPDTTNQASDSQDENDHVGHCTANLKRQNVTDVKDDQTPSHNKDGEGKDDEDDYVGRRMVALKRLAKVHKVTVSSDEGDDCIEHRLYALPKGRENQPQPLGKKEIEEIETAKDPKAGLKHVGNIDTENIDKNKPHDEARSLVDGLKKTGAHNPRTFGKDVTNGQPGDMREVPAKRRAYGDRPATTSGKENTNAENGSLKTTPCPELVSEAKTISEWRIRSRPSSEPVSSTNAPMTHVKHFNLPELTSSASRDSKTQREVAALRSMKRVVRGSRVIANTKAFGGAATANAGAEEYEGVMSLKCVGILEKYRKEKGVGQAA